MAATIYKATVDDAELIADLSRSTFYDTFAPHNSEQDMQKFLREQFTRGKLMLEVGSVGNDFFLARDEKGDVMGYLKMRITNHPKELGQLNSVEIARLYAVKSAIGKGIGKLLMQTAIDYGIDAGADVIWLGVWQENHRAINFYQKWGFEKFADTDFLLGDDLQHDWLMKKII